MNFNNMIAPVEAVAWVLPNELADLKDPRHPRQSLTIWGHKSWTGFVPLYAHPAPIKPSADTGELRERMKRAIWTQLPQEDANMGTSGRIADAILDLIQSEKYK